MTRPSETEQDLRRAAEAGQVLDLSRCGDNVLRARVIRDILRANDADPLGITVRGARISGQLDLDFIRSSLPLALDGCVFEEPLSIFDTELPALSLDDSTLPGVAGEGLHTRFFSMRDVRCTGVLDLDNARVDGPLWLTGSRLGWLCASSLRVSRDFRAEGLFVESDGVAVLLESCEVGVDLMLDDAVLISREATALMLNGVQVGGKITLADAFLKADEALAVIDATAGGLIMNGTVVRGTICTDGTHFTSEVKFKGAFDARADSTEAAIRMVDTRIGAGLVINGSVRNPRGQAVMVHRTTIDASITVLDVTVEADSPKSALEISNTDVGGELVVRPDRLVNHGSGYELDLFGTRAGRALGLDAQDLIKAEIFTVTLNGLTYPDPPDDTGAWLRMLAEHTFVYEAQPYQQLAAVHRAAGHEHTARKVLIAQQEDLRKHGDPGNKVWHWFLGKTLAYGYKPSRAVAGLLITFLLSIALVWVAGTDSGLSPAKDRPADSCSPVNRISLAADLAIPLVKLGGTPRCEFANGAAGQWATGVGWAVQFMGWSFATLSVAGFTGLVRKT